MRKGRTVLEAKRYGIHSCLQTDNLLHVARKLLERDISALVVVNQKGGLVGIISRTDLLRACAEDENWPGKSVTRYMSTDVVTVTPQTLLRDVAMILLENHIHRVVVTREENGIQVPVAVLSDGDFVYHMVKDAEQEPA